MSVIKLYIDIFIYLNIYMSVIKLCIDIFIYLHIYISKNMMIYLFICSFLMFHITIVIYYLFCFPLSQAALQALGNAPPLQPSPIAGQARGANPSTRSITARRVSGAL